MDRRIDHEGHYLASQDLPRHMIHDASLMIPDSDPHDRLFYQLSALTKVINIPVLKRHVCFFQIKYYLSWSDSSLSPESPSPEGTLCHPLCQCAKCQSLQGVSIRQIKTMLIFECVCFFQNKIETSPMPKLCIYHVPWL